MSSAAGGKGTFKELRLAPPKPSERSVTESTDKVGAAAARSWTFVTNHAQVLLYLSRNPDALVSELADAVQVTERAAYRILDDLQEAGYITRTRRGRRNRYGLNAELSLGDPVVEDLHIADLLALMPEAETQAHVSPFRTRCTTAAGTEHALERKISPTIGD